MIPVRLQLHNFMSYGEDIKSLDFRSIDLACFSGVNGAGKSSLLESMSWALWGKSRAKSDDDLIKLGTHEMWVDFEFELEGARYKVVRKRSKKKKGQGNLEFMMLADLSKGLSNREYFFAYNINFFYSSIVALISNNNFKCFFSSLINFIITSFVFSLIKSIKP